jgi:hypothetical protein
MTRSRFTLVVGAALILVANGVALTGVAYNRSGEPDSRLELSQRELERPWKAYFNKENSGLALTLEWRVPTSDADSATFYYGGYGRSPTWLNEKRMAELGFDVQRAKREDARREKYADQSEREVLVVLELAGSAWQHALEQARRRLARQESLRQASPGARELVEAKKRAREHLAREETRHSRLFAIDAGTDLASLRAKYPDRSRYLILEGHVHLNRTSINGTHVISGYLGKLSVDEINVPHALRGVFEAMPPRTVDPDQQKPPFTATVAVGKRLEPWIEKVTRP